MPANLAGYPAFSLLDLPFSSIRVGRKSIRPTKRPEGAILSIYRSPHLSLRDTCRAYAIRPYPTGRRYFYHACHQFFPGIRPFLVLIQEKDAKRKSRHQGCLPNFPAPEGVIRDAGQFGQVPEWVVRDAGQFGRVPDPLVFSFPFFDLPSPYDSDRRYDCESRCDRATVYVRLEPMSRGLLY